MASHHIINQPMSLASMDPYSDYNHDEKRHTSTSPCHHCECADTNHSLPHRACHQSRLRRLLIPALVSIATVATIFVISCIRNLEILAAFLPDDGVLGLSKRALGAGDTTGSDQSSFVHKKFYLIVVLVGLLVVVILGIMLSAWCCRESFENPCCFPCYLCACCGGLACLECIACGLCAEGVADVV